MRKILLFTLFITTSFLLFSEEIKSPVKLEINKNAFDENSIFSINNEDGDIICQFDRFENKNSAVKSIKVFNENKEHEYTIAADDVDQYISILSKDGKIGKILMKASISGVKIKINSELKYFGKTYEMKVNVTTGFNKFSMEYLIYNNKKLVIKQIFTGSSTDLEKSIVVDKDYLSDNKLDCGVLILSILAFDELSKENSKMNSSSNSNF